MIAMSNDAIFAKKEERVRKQLEIETSLIRFFCANEQSKGHAPVLRSSPKCQTIQRCLRKKFPKTSAAAHLLGSCLPWACSARPLLSLHFVETSWKVFGDLPAWYNYSVSPSETNRPMVFMVQKPSCIPIMNCVPWLIHLDHQRRNSWVRLHAHFFYDP